MSVSRLASAFLSSSSMNVLVMWMFPMLVSMSRQESAATTAPVQCPQHFQERVRDCLEPYWTVAALYSPTGQPFSANDVLARHLCLQFEMSLVCLHHALTACPGHSNVRYVQSKLGSLWAVQVRDFCVAQSPAATPPMGSWTGELPASPVHSLLDSSGDWLRQLLSGLRRAGGGAADGATDDDDDENLGKDEEGGGSRERQVVVVIPAREENLPLPRHTLVPRLAKSQRQLRPRHPGHRRDQLLRSQHVEVVDVNVYNVLARASPMQQPTAASGTVATLSLSLVTGLLCAVTAIHAPSLL